MEVPYVGMRVVTRIIRGVVLETESDKDTVGVSGMAEDGSESCGAQSIPVRGDRYIDGFHLFIVARTDGKINFIFDSNIKWTIMIIKNRNDVHVAA
jgi:hypothetical protein